MKLFFKLVVYFASLLAFSTAYAIDPPTPEFPSNGKDSVSPARVTFRVKFNSGASWARYQVDSTPNFDSEFLKDESYNSSTRFLEVDSMKFNKTYYWRAQLYNYQKTDSSGWTETFTFTTTPGNKMYIDEVQTHDRFYYKTKGTFWTNVKMDVIIDTVATLNSPYARNAYEALFDKDKYFYRYRSIYLNDTSGWSNLDSFETAFRFSPYLSDQCVDGEVRIRTLVYTGMTVTGLPSINLKVYSDSTKSVLFLDTTITNTRELHLYRKNCQSLFLSYSASNAYNTSVYETHYKPCDYLAQQEGYFFLSDSIRIYYSTCTDSFEIQFDTSGQFDISSRTTYKGQVDGPKRLKTLAYDLNRHPYSYFARLRFFVLGQWTDWVNYGKFYKPSLRILGSQATIQDSNYHRLQLAIGFTPLKNYPPIQHEYWFDNTSSFNSGKLKKIILTDTVAMYRQGFLYGNTYVKARLVTPNGATEWSETVHKPISQSYRFRYPTQNEYKLPFANPSAIPGIGEDLHQYQYNTDSTFPKATILTFVNQSPELENAKTYFVRVRGVNPLDTAPWSKPMEYRTINTSQLLHPNRLTPSDSVNFISNTQIDFSWEPKAQDLADQYYIVIYQDTIKPLNVVYFKEVTNQLDLQVEGLKPNKKYFWTVISGGSPRNIEDISYSCFSTFDASTANSIISNDLRVYPNPVTDMLFIKELEMSQVESIAVYDVNGKNIKSFKQVNEASISVKDLLPNHYVLSIRLKSGNVLYHSFLKR